MYRLLESIRVENGMMMNQNYHQHRISESSKKLNLTPFDLHKIEIPDNYKNGMVKLRIVYSFDIESIKFEFYNMKKINSLKIIENDSIEYKYKFYDRSRLNDLIHFKGNCDDIIITKYGFLTDTSYSNIVFSKNGEYFTPNTPLLAGTMRQKLLDKKIINEISIKISDIDKFEYCKIINAMIKIEDSPKIKEIVF